MVLGSFEQFTQVTPNVIFVKSILEIIFFPTVLERNLIRILTCCLEKLGSIKYSAGPSTLLTLSDPILDFQEIDLKSHGFFSLEDV